MAFQHKSISQGVKQCSISSRICSPIAGRKGLYHRTSGVQSWSLCTKTREKIRLFKLSRHHSVLHCPLGLGELQACPFPGAVFPPLLFAFSSSPAQQCCPLIILHGPKLCLECTASSLVCCLGSLFIRFCKQMIVARAFLFKQLLDFLICIIKLSWSLDVSWSTGHQLQPCSIVFICFHCSSGSAAVTL